MRGMRMKKPGLWVWKVLVGRLLEACWRPLGGLSGASWGLLGAPWGLLGMSESILGASRSPLGRPWPVVGRPWPVASWGKGPLGEAKRAVGLVNF